MQQSWGKCSILIPIFSISPEYVVHFVKLRVQIRNTCWMCHLACLRGDNITDLVSTLSGFFFSNGGRIAWIQVRPIVKTRSVHYIEVYFNHRCGHGLLEKKRKRGPLETTKNWGSESEMLRGWPALLFFGSFLMICKWTPSPTSGDVNCSLVFTCFSVEVVAMMVVGRGVDSSLENKSSKKKQQEALTSIWVLRCLQRRPARWWWCNPTSSSVMGISPKADPRNRIFSLFIALSPLLYPGSFIFSSDRAIFFGYCQFNVKVNCGCDASYSDSCFSSSKAIRV